MHKLESQLIKRGACFQIILLSIAAAVLTGCDTTPPPGSERGPYGTISYNVPVESSEPGAQIDVNGETAGTTPMILKIYGDRDGTFHNFGSYEFIIRAHPPGVGRPAQTKVFHTGVLMGSDDKIPQKVYFDFGTPRNQ